MSVEHRTDRDWIREHLTRALRDRHCELTVLGGGRTVLKGRWPLMKETRGETLPEGASVHLRYEAAGRACGFFTRVTASDGGYLLLDEPHELLVVRKAA